MFDLKGKRIWVAGHNGMVGRAISKALTNEGSQLITADRKILDLRKQANVEAYVRQTRPDAIVIAAAKVGGIAANASQPADFLYNNLVIETNIIHAAHQNHVKKLLFLGSSCIYPREAPQPIPESALLTGPLEPTNQWYAVAKIAGLMLCQAYRQQFGNDFITAMPTNLYGPHDKFDPETAHVIPALIQKFHRAKSNLSSSVAIWGSGAPMREFLHVDDLATALVLLLKNYSGPEAVNIGSGTDIAIKDLAALVAKTVGYTGEITYDTSKPDGTPKKLLDSAKITALGFKPSISLEEGLRQTYAWFNANPH